MSVDLVQLTNRLQYKDTRSIFIRTNKSANFIKLNTPLNLDPKLLYTLRLESFNGWESAVNVTTKNNTFRYSYDNGSNWITIRLSTGLYTISNIDTIMHQTMKQNNHFLAGSSSSTDTYYINFYVDENQNRVFMKLTNNYQVDFSISDLYLIFGFNKQIYSEQNINIYAPNIGKISNSLQLLISCDLVTPSQYVDVDGKIKSCRYISSFPLFLNQANSRLIIRDPNPTKFTVDRNKYNTDSFSLDLVNENLELIDFNGETSNITLVFESC